MFFCISHREPHDCAHSTMVLRCSTSGSSMAKKNNRRSFHSLATRIAQRIPRELLEEFFYIWGVAVGHFPPPLVDVDSSSDWDRPVYTCCIWRGCIFVCRNSFVDMLLLLMLMLLFFCRSWWCTYVRSCYCCGCWNHGWCGCGCTFL